MFYYMDTTHFLEYLNTFKSPNYETNARKFRGEIPGSKDEPEKFLKTQWDKAFKDKQMRHEHVTKPSS